MPFVGCLCTGVMLTGEGVKTLEYNARFGDPETQTLLPILRNDLVEILVACTEGRLHEVEAEMEDRSCAVVVLISGGYPGDIEKGKVVTMKSSWVSMKGELDYFHAGTKKLESGELVTDVGRVMAVSATAPSLKEAVAYAYIGVRSVEFGGMHYRKDIAHSAFGHKSSVSEIEETKGDNSQPA